MTLTPWEQVSTELPPQDEDSEFTLASDFEIGHFFRERVVPRAVLYFTGEAVEDDDNVGAWGRGGRAARAAGQCAPGPGEEAWPRRLGAEHPGPESACAVTPFRVSSRPTGSLLHASCVAGVISRRGDCHAAPRGDSQS